MSAPVCTTLNAIRANSPCADGWAKLLAHLGKTGADDAPLPLVTILDSNGLEDALWALRAVKGHEREMRLFAVWCARQVQHLVTDPRSVAALDVAERYAAGLATREELEAAWAAAWEAASSPTGAVASEAAGEAARSAAWAAGEAAGEAAWEAWEATGEVQAAEFRRVFGGAE
jgi:hypothetical protein